MFFISPSQSVELSNAPWASTILSPVPRATFASFPSPGSTAPTFDPESMGPSSQSQCSLHVELVPSAWIQCIQQYGVNQCQTIELAPR
jgi:hypothetical protein